MKRTPLRKVSKSQASRLRKYSELRGAFLDAVCVCQICGVWGDRDIHHKAGRGRNLLAVETWMAVCRACHTWIHDNPNLARKLGFLK